MHIIKTIPKAIWLEQEVLEIIQLSSFKYKKKCIFAPISNYSYWTLVKIAMYIHSSYTA